jgi:hypothetical protein
LASTSGASAATEPSIPFDSGKGTSLALNSRMCRRLVAALMLVLTLTAGAGARRGDPLAVEEKLTAEEEREVAQLAEQFTKSLEKNDLSALIDALYVTDFDEHLRSNLNQYSYVALVEKDVIERAPSEDLRRFYIAVTNFYYASGFLYIIKSYEVQRGGENEEREPAINELLSPDVIAVLKSDPILAEMVAEAEDEERRRDSRPYEETEERRESSNEIKSIEGLRGFAATLEKASALIRAHAKTLAGERTLSEMLSEIERRKREESSENDDGETARPPFKILDTDFSDFRQGKGSITVQVLMFNLNLVKAEGKLKIASAHMISD